MRDALLAAALTLAAWGGSASAEDGPPTLDIERTCQASQTAGKAISDNASVEGCMRSEQAARDELKKRWSEFPTAAKSQCSQQANAGGYPSYVETVTCLELASGTVPTQSERARGLTRKEKGGDLTAEPSPRQRTNPIDVLENRR